MVTESLEPTWTYLKELDKLKAQLKNNSNNIDNLIKSQEQQLTEALITVKKQTIENSSIINQKLDLTCSDLISKVNDINKNSQSKLNDISRNIQLKIDNLDKEHNDKLNQVYNTLDFYKKQLDTLHFDIIDNEDNIAITYVNPNGKVEYGSFKKLIPDGKTLKYDADNKVYLNYTFNPKTFNISSNNDIKVTGLSLNGNGYLNADRINNDLNNATYNIKSLTYKVDSILQKINNINGYMASNNFKKDAPEQEELTKFAIECISTSTNKITIDQIPAGTKIKNTFDNHIWILNRLVKDGLTTHKWEDFGADTICIAGNDGVHGLVTGSHDHFKAFIDINGVVSINGLEEDFQDVLRLLSELSTQIKDIQSDYESKLSSIELRLSQLEGKNA